MHIFNTGTLFANIDWLNRYSYMNVNLLTIDNNLAGKTGTSSFPSNSDSKTKGARFALNSDDEKLQVKNPEKPATDNIKEKAQNHKKTVSDSSQEFKQSVDKKLKSENPCNADNKAEPKEQNAIPDSFKQQNKQPNIIQFLLFENSIAAEQSKEGISKKIESKPGHQLTQIIANQHNDKSPPVTGHAEKSAQIKLLQTTEKGQLGLKTITTDASKSTPADKIQTGIQNNKKVTVLTKTIAETKSVTEKEAKELASGLSDKTDENTNRTRIKEQPSVNIDLAKVQNKFSEKQTEHSNINLEKHILTAETDAKANISQNISNLSNPNNKEAIPASNNFSENQSGQKLNITAVQVNAGQTKDQNILTSNKSHSQGFGQMLSQSNSQTLITEQSTAAKNTTIANPTGHSSSSYVSADIGRQILESVQQSISQQRTDHQITVRLNPPELGKVFIRFQQQDTELTGIMEVNRTQTRFEIEQALPQIIRNLADFGIQIKRLEVMLSNEQQSGQGALGNQSLQSGTAQQQYSGNPGTSGNDTGIHENNEWLSNNNSYENLSELQGTLITDGSINLLI